MELLTRGWTRRQLLKSHGRGSSCRKRWSVVKQQQSYEGMVLQSKECVGVVSRGHLPANLPRAV